MSNMKHISKIEDFWSPNYVFIDFIVTHSNTLSEWKVLEMEEDSDWWHIKDSSAIQGADNVYTPLDAEDKWNNRNPPSSSYLQATGSSLTIIQSIRCEDENDLCNM